MPACVRKYIGHFWHQAHACIHRDIEEEQTKGQVGRECERDSNRQTGSDGPMERQRDREADGDREIQTEQHKPDPLTLTKPIQTITLRGTG